MTSANSGKLFISHSTPAWRMRAPLRPTEADELLWSVDEAGRLNQALARVSEQVIFVAAGLPMLLKADKLPC